MVKELIGFKTDSPSIFHSGTVEQALQEYAELMIFDGLVRTGTYPSVEQVGVPETTYLLGIADVVGELRRRCLDQLTKGDVEGAKASLEQMMMITDSLAPVHFPNALLPLRKKKDVARMLVERTHGDLLRSIQ